VKLDLAAVDEREKVPADKQEHHRAEAEYQHGDDRHDGPPLQQRGEELRISIPQSLEAAVECGGHAREKACGSPVIRVATFALEQQADGDRRQGPRQSVGSQHREHDGESQRREQVPGRSVEEHDRCKHAADGKRRDQGRHRDFGGAMQRRLRKRHALFGPQAMGVLDSDGRIVDQYADRQR
jgi:hypothetical protein